MKKKERSEDALAEEDEANEVPLIPDELAEGENEKKCQVPFIGCELDDVQ